jgi:Fic family protein
MICWMHRVAVELSSRPDNFRGVLRQVSVTIANGNGQTIYVPPSPEEVPAALNMWVNSWRDGYEALLRGSRDEKIAALADFYYKFLEIRPFMDGNGRMGFILLDQASRELSQRPVSRSLILESDQLFKELNAVNGGDMSLLRDRTNRALT